MASLLNKAAQHVFDLYAKAEGLIEEEIELPIASTMLNHFIDRFVTQNVDVIDNMRVEPYEGWLRLFATIRYRGIYVTLSTDLALIQFQVDGEIQRLVFEQKSNTRVIEARFNHFYEKWACKLLLLFYFHVLHKDPLGTILERLNVVNLEHDLLFLDIHRYIKDNLRVMQQLKKVSINHAVLREDQLVLKGNINIRQIMGDTALSSVSLKAFIETDK